MRSGRAISEGACASVSVYTDTNVADVHDRYQRYRRRHASTADFSSIPTLRQAVTHLDLDLTLACNLRCSYCFKVKDSEHLDLQIAMDAITWLIYASGDAEEISVVMIGGEPLVRFDTMRRLVPFAVRRAMQHGKRLRFSITTNGTIVNDDILSFFRKWSIGFHTSIDGHPKVQDQHRRYADGRGSSRTLARNLPRVLEAQPGTCARSTVMPDTASELFKSFEYFLELGYRRMAFVPAAPDEWDDDSISVLRDQVDRIAQAVVASFRAGQFLNVKYIDDMCRATAEGKVDRGAPCGVGRGMMLVDINGDLWPCHRWSKQTREWVLGSLYQPGEHADRRAVFFDIPKKKSTTYACETCVARPICAGGCPAENLEETGHLWQRHERSCELERVFAEAGVKVFEILNAEQNPAFRKTYFSEESKTE